jgi:hypothetical protein
MNPVGSTADVKPIVASARFDESALEEWMRDIRNPMPSQRPGVDRPHRHGRRADRSGSTGEGNNALTIMPDHSMGLAGRYEEREDAKNNLSRLW